MSIAILKKKTRNGNPRIAPISGKQRDNHSNGFAINGTLRLGPSVGVDLGGNFLDTRANDNRIQLKRSCGNISCTNDPDVVKTSVKNTRGFLSSRGNICPKGQCLATKLIHGQS